MRTNKLLVLVLTLSFSGTMQAQDLLEIYQAAKKSDPTWRGEVYNNKSAQEGTVQSYANFLPDISLSGTSTSNFNDTENNSNPAADRRETYNSNSWTLSITQPVFRMQNYALHRQAKAEVRQSDYQLAASAEDLIIRVAQAYFDALSAESELTSTRAEKKAIERQLDQAKKRFEVGLIAITDVHEAQASYDQAIANEIDAESDVLLAKQELSEITGEHYELINPVRETIELVSPDPENVNEWIQQALDNNNSLASSMAAVEVAQQNVDAQKAGHYPTLDLVVSGGNSTSHSQTGSITDSESIALQFNLPIYSGGATNSAIRQSVALLQKSREDLTKSKRSTERETRDAYLSVISDISRIQALRQAVVSSQSALDATEAGFEVGTRTIVDVLDAQKALYSSISDFQQARHSYIVNGLKLKQAAGSLSEEDIASINQLLSKP